MGSCGSCAVRSGGVLHPRGRSEKMFSCGEWSGSGRGGAFTQKLEPAANRDFDEFKRKDFGGRTASRLESSDQ